MWRDLPYLFEVQICFTLLWLFYQSLLSRDKSFGRNRGYLLLSVPLAFVLPLLSIPVLPAVPVTVFVSPAVLSSSVMVGPTADAAPMGVLQSVDWLGLFGLIALLGSVLMLVLLVENAVRLHAVTRHAVTRSVDGLRISYTDRAESAFSLFNRIYINEKDIAPEDIPQVITHEMCHVKLLHSWDLVLAAAVRILFWWNPFVWLWYRSLREVHEYQADEAVLGGGYDSEQYITLMLQQLTGRQPDLVNGFNYSLIRKRLLMISRERQLRYARAKMSLALPLLAVLLLLFSFTEQQVETRILAEAGTATTGERPSPASAAEPVFEAVGTPEATGPVSLRNDREPADRVPKPAVARPLTDGEVALESEDRSPAPVPEKEKGTRKKQETGFLAALTEGMGMRLKGIRDEIKPYRSRKTSFKIDRLDDYRIRVDGRTLNPEEFVAIDSMSVDSIQVDNVNKVITAVTGTSGRQVRIDINPVPEGKAVAVSDPKESFRSVVQRYNPIRNTRDTLAAVNVVVDQLPRFQGVELFESHFDQWVSNQLDPVLVASGKRERKKGKNKDSCINVVYTVKASGKIADVKVLSETNEALTEAAVTAINSSPLWSPAMNNGVPVDVTLTSRIVL